MAKNKNAFAPVSLEKYITDKNRKRYMTYQKATMFYSMPYYALVKIAKEANASWKIRKTAIVDLDILDSYLEEIRKGKSGE